MELMANNSVVIADIEITRDVEGRYNLNALHRASGSDKKNGPSYWLSLKTTQDLISELEKETTEITVVSIEGRNGGTFAHELLVVSYAGWISPAFQLKVNQAFLDSRKPKQITIPQTLSEALQLAADQARQLEEQAPKVSFFDTVAKNEHCFNATQVAQKFGLGVVTFNKYLMELGIYNKSTAKKTFKQDFINKGLGEMKMTSNGFSQAVFTVKGQQYLHELLTSEGII